MKMFHQHNDKNQTGTGANLSRTETLSRILDVAKELIAIPSVTGEERQIMEFMEKELIQRGWHVERWPTSEENRWNVYATATQKNPRIVFSTHLDVVPAIDPEQFTPKLTDTLLIGRGACDTKGIVGCMIEACESMRKDGAEDIGLLFVVDEEKISIGAKAAAPMLKARGVEFVINGEPSENKLVSYQKGFFSGIVKFTGRAYHSGYPEFGVDANKALIKFCHGLMEMNFGSDPARGDVTINFGKIAGGRAANIVSELAEVEFAIRTVGRSAEFESKIVGVLGDVTQSIANIEANFERKSCTDPYEPLIVPGFETTVFNGGTDAPHLAKSGAKVLMLGPGSVHDAHTATEKISFEQLSEAYDLYKRLYAILSNGQF